MLHIFSNVAKAVARLHHRTKLVIHRDLKVCTIELQWNPSITDTFGEQCFGLYTEVAFVEGLFCTQTVHLGPGRYIATGLYSEVVVNGGSTVLRLGDNILAACIQKLFIWDLIACS